jgi:hypothetical protein
MGCSSRYSCQSSSSVTPGRFSSRWIIASSGAIAAPSLLVRADKGAAPAPRRPGSPEVAKPARPAAPTAGNRGQLSPLSTGSPRSCGWTCRRPSIAACPRCCAWVISLPAWGPRPPWRNGEATRIRVSPTGAVTRFPLIHNPLLGIVRNRCSGSVGTTARDQSERRSGLIRIPARDHSVLEHTASLLDEPAKAAWSMSTKEARCYKSVACRAWAARVSRSPS